MSQHPEYQDCALLCDAMNLKASTIYHKEKGCFDGFINYGEKVVVEDENKIAAEALVFMLVGLKGHWMYPVGYILCDKVNNECLLSVILTEAMDHGINVQSVTMDGTTTNINAMKLFRRKFGNTSDTIGSFSFEGFDYKLYFIIDPCHHMLKLARTALSDAGVFVDGNNHEIKWKHIQKTCRNCKKRNV